MGAAASSQSPPEIPLGGSPKREAGTRVLLTPPRQSSPEQGPPHRPRGWGEWDSARHGVRSPGSPPRGGSWWGEAERRRGESPGREERGRGRQAEEGPRDEAPWGGSEHGGVLGSLERLAWEQGGDQWRNPDWVKDQPATLARGGSPARSDRQHSQSRDPDGWGSSASFQSGWAADGTEEGTPEMEEELGWDAAGEDGVPAGSDGAHPTPQEWTPCQEVVDYWTRACRTCLSFRQRRRLMLSCPRPTLPDRSHETPALNADIASLGVAPQQRADLVDAQKLGWLQDEVLDTLAPAMSVYEMAEEALEKRAPVDPLELRECAQRLLRLLGSLSARLTLQRRVKALRAINPRLQSICSKMTSRNCNGMLFGEDKVQLLKELLARFPQLTQNNTTYKRTRTQRRKSKVYSGQPPQGAGTQGGGMLCFKEEFQQTDTISQGEDAATTCCPTCTPRPPVVPPQPRQEQSGEGRGAPATGDLSRGLFGGETLPVLWGRLPLGLPQHEGAAGSHSGSLSAHTVDGGEDFPLFLPGLRGIVPQHASSHGTHQGALQAQPLLQVRELHDAFPDVPVPLQAPPQLLLRRNRRRCCRRRRRHPAPGTGEAPPGKGAPREAAGGPPQTADGHTAAQEASHPPRPDGGPAAGPRPAPCRPPGALACPAPGAPRLSSAGALPLRTPATPGQVSRAGSPHAPGTLPALRPSGELRLASRRRPEPPPSLPAGTGTPHLQRRLEEKPGALLQQPHRVGAHAGALQLPAVLLLDGVAGGGHPARRGPPQEPLPARAPGRRNGLWGGAPLVPPPTDAGSGEHPLLPAVRLPRC
uniref:uncharacterized protein LOC114588709 isoform X2 n=1 Tax=Podarcis muralis TaxID=64176 RepID=UPI0010A02052|nr:uncharacterized protein LOC114588709 isoform X2 [Podarcis muralis]